MQDAFRRISVIGTSASPEGYGPPYKDPWFVVDTSTAEHEVNWWGDLISVHHTADEADDARWEAIAQTVEKSGTPTDDPLST
jgi:hypothetical protein